MATFILIPGAWLGGWCWDRVADQLRTAGHRVLTPTLTGLGDRAHLLTRDVSLRTHVLDVIDVIVHATVRDVILVGHSYGGTVITAVADEIPEWLRWLVFLDATVPRTGESNNDALPRELAHGLRERARTAGNAWLVPPPSTEAWRLDPETRPWVESMLTPHPLATLEEPVSLRGDARDVRRAFVLTSPASRWYRAVSDRARRNGWACRELDGGHYAMLTAPGAVAQALIELEPEGVPG